MMDVPESTIAFVSSAATKDSPLTVKSPNVISH